MITKKDIAEKLGISRTTVSLVLNRKPDARISEETSQKILAMARELGYKEQGDMETQNLICYVLCNRRLDRTNYFEGLRTLETVASGLGFRVIFTTIDHSEDDFDRLKNLLTTPGVKGAVLAGEFNRNIINLIKSWNVPFVANGVTDIDGINLVFPDHHLAGFKAADFLVGLGHTRIAFFTGELHKLTHNRIMEGYRAALEAHNILYDPSLIQVSSLERGDDLIQRTKKLGIKYTAIIAANEQMGIDALTELKAEGRSVPEEISIIAIGGGSLGIQCRPKLSVVMCKENAIAETLIDMLERNINNYTLEPQKEVIETILVDRESTGPCPT